MANNSCKNLFPTPYPLATIHPLQTNGQTDDKHDNSSTFTKVRSAKKPLWSTCVLKKSDA